MSIDSSPPPPPPPSPPVPPPLASSCSSITGHAQPAPRGRFMTAVRPKQNTQGRGRGRETEADEGRASQGQMTATDAKEGESQTRCGLRSRPAVASTTRAVP
ncbi:hypothetical protein I4F81_007197 [Pyropia yezoensis]|uniref:Uncharacterized protein n=1 Tax=Pyropia yezoensis TaxID=2788 RepID=A0ACC3C3H5_PYRYE|nr:hypothetical protein I4F81_007197 [Neopyropia yezoensis]